MRGSIFFLPWVLSSEVGVWAIVLSFRLLFFGACFEYCLVNRRISCFSEIVFLRLYHSCFFFLVEKLVLRRCINGVSFPRVGLEIPLFVSS